MARRSAVAPWREVPRQDGRRFVVTGASAGIGLETARSLAERGAHVVLAVRNQAKGEAAAQTIAGDVEVRILDVADLSSVRAFASDLGEVDVLVNNAGALGLPFSRSPDGVELHFATNHLGHFALTNLLLPQLSDRVVVVGSRSHHSGALDLDDLDWTQRGYRAYAAYAQSKLANLLFLAELQRRLTAVGSTVRATGAHPGSTRHLDHVAYRKPGQDLDRILRSSTHRDASHGGGPCRRSSPPRWTCPATLTSGRTGSARCVAGR